MLGETSLRAAIVGCGNIGGGYDRVPPARNEDAQGSMTHAGAYLLHPETVLAAVADVNVQNLEDFKQKWGVQSTYRDYQEMFGAESIDIASICTPTNTHSQVLAAALDVGIETIFVEKPISQNRDEARRMVAQAEGRQVAVNYYRRWNNSIRNLREDIDSGRWGHPIAACVRYTKGLWVNGSHFIDLFRWFFGEPQSVRTFRRHGRADTDDPGYDFALTFANGLAVDFHHLPDASYVFLDVEIFFRNGRVSLRQRGQIVQTEIGVPEPKFGSFHILGGSQTKETSWQFCLPTAVRELVAQRDAGEPPACTLEDGCRVVEICEKIAG